MWENAEGFESRCRADWKWHISVALKKVKFEILFIANG